MNGAQGVIQMRMGGKKPSIVFLNDYPCQTNWFETGDHATVEIGPKDQPEWLDLRFLVGLRVAVAGTDEKRLKRVFEACKKAGAKTVAACVVDKSVGNLYGTLSYKPGWCEVWHG